MSARMRVAGALLIAALVAIGLAALADTAQSHTGHQQKKLFPERWHHQPNGDFDAWMTLSTSDVWLFCDGSEATCAAKWDEPFGDSLADWNGQPTTVRFGYSDGVQDEDFDVDVYVYDEVPGDPGLLGVAPTFDINGDPCFGSCSVYSGIVYIGDDIHSGDYGADSDRLATLSHELGHIIQLAHESTNPSETLLFDCGLDDTGPIPHSVMAYDCIDPVSVGGAGESAVRPWDACGVNHAYPAPAFGFFSGCDLTTTTPAATQTAPPSLTPSASPPPATPTPTAAPSPSPSPLVLTVVWGDVNCSGSADPVDSLTLLRFDSNLSVGQPAGCPAVGHDLATASVIFAWGDVDCGGGINPVDALKVLRGDAGLTVNTAPGCPEIGGDLPVVVPA